MTKEEINKANRDYTTPEQSKRLLALGVPANSANMYYYYDFGTGFIYAPDLLDDIEDFDDPRYLPCWTTGRLMWIINKCVPKSYNRFLIFTNMNLHQIADFIEMNLITYEVLVQQEMIDFSRLEE